MGCRTERTTQNPTPELGGGVRTFPHKPEGQGGTTSAWGQEVAVVWRLHVTVWENAHLGLFLWTPMGQGAQGPPSPPRPRKPMDLALPEPGPCCVPRASCLLPGAAVSPPTWEAPGPARRPISLQGPLLCQAEQQVSSCAERDVLACGPSRPTVFTSGRVHPESQGVTQGGAGVGPFLQGGQGCGRGRQRGPQGGG